ncbi:ribonuclease H-like domain-containing protein [Tanacetum coccineum]
MTGCSGVGGETIGRLVVLLGDDGVSYLLGGWWWHIWWVVGGGDGWLVIIRLEGEEGKRTQPNREESPIEAVATAPLKTEKSTRARQKRMIQNDDAPRQIAWIHEEKIALCKGCVDIFENSMIGNSRKEAGFWAQESGAGDEDYFHRALMDYQVETGTTFKNLHCWAILKHIPKWEQSELPKFAAESAGGSKRCKSSSSSSFNTDYGEASINLNTNVGDDNEDEVQEIRQPIGRDEARDAAKKKWSRASRAS